MYFYTQCIRIQNVLFLHPSHEFIALRIFTHTEYTQCVVLQTVCNYEIVEDYKNTHLFVKLLCV